MGGATGTPPRLIANPEGCRRYLNSRKRCCPPVTRVRVSAAQPARNARPTAYRRAWNPSHGTPLTSMIPGLSNETVEVSPASSHSPCLFSRDYTTAHPREGSPVATTPGENSRGAWNPSCTLRIHRCPLHEENTCCQQHANPVTAHRQISGVGKREKPLSAMLQHTAPHTLAVARAPVAP